MTGRSCLADCLCQGRIALGPLLQDPSRVPAVPVVAIKRELDQFLVGTLLEINSWEFYVAVADSEDTPIAPVMAVRIIVVALVLVVPINQIDRAVRAGLKVQDLRPFVVEVDEVGAMV